jgi:CubicO group peptidase (beta-lactamase class C family)
MRRALLALCVLGVLVCRVAAQGSSLDSVVEPYVKSRAFMGAVLVARDGDILLNKGYGSANLEWDIPNTPTTKFRLGSLTKQFTAASILLLEERGRLKVEDPVKKYLPDAPAAWDRITIFNLLTHSSGIPNFTGFPEYKSIEPFSISAEKLVAMFRDKPLDFAPGEKMSYSNSGYVLLGRLIEIIAGLSYPTFVHDNLFVPLAMNDSGYDSNSAIIPRRASGYSPLGTTLTNAGFIHMSVPHAAGALYSTTEDLLKWERGLFGGRVISAASLRKMTTPYKNNYAFGLVVRDEDGHKTISHNGGIEGFNTMLIYYPDQKVTVVVLGNVNGNAPTEIALKLASMAVD